jgi:F-type H+-transporting ATPase subunit gamma
MLVISTGRGLCGGLNTNLYKAVRRNASDDTEYVTVGKKLRQTIAKTGGRIVTDWDVADPVPFNDAKPISKFLTEQFLSGEYDKISVAFNNFVSTLTQTPEVFQLLPIESKDLGEKQDYEGVGKGEIDETDAITNLSPTPQASSISSSHFTSTSRSTRCWSKLVLPSTPHGWLP